MTRIVVGVDGSEGSVEALRWALQHAEATGASVVAIHAWHDVYVSAAPFTTAIDPQAYVDASEGILERAVAEATEGRGAAIVERKVVHDGPAGAILEASGDASLVVVGSRGRGGFTGLLLGSVSQQVVHHARCPVVIIPAGWRTS